MTRKVFTRERATSGDAQMLMDQTVMVFASASARDAGIPSGQRTVGMRVFILDSFTEQFWDGSAWRRAGGRTNIGRVALGGVTTDAGGYLIVAHGLGVAPGKIGITVTKQGSDLLDRIGDVRVSNYDATNFVVRFIRTDTSAYLTSSAIAFDWDVHL